MLSAPGQRMVNKLSQILQAKILSFQKSAEKNAGLRVTSPTDKVNVREKVLACLGQMGPAYGMAGPEVGRRSLVAEASKDSTPVNRRAAILTSPLSTKPQISERA